jgi:hypothetical protein
MKKHASLVRHPLQLKAHEISLEVFETPQIGVARLLRELDQVFEPLGVHFVIFLLTVAALMKLVGWCSHSIAKMLVSARDFWSRVSVWATLLK